MPLLKKNYDPATMAGAVDSITADLQDVLDTSGNEIIEYDEVASATNNIGIRNAATGDNPIIYQTGEADVGITLAGFDGTNTEEILILDANATAVNEFTIDNAATGSDPVFAATGGDTNIGVQLTPKGTAVVLLGNLGTTTTIAQGTATVNAQRGVIQTGAAITSAGTTTAYSFDFVNNKIYTTSVLALLLADPTGNGTLGLGPVTMGQGSATVRLVNLEHDEASSGSVKIHFVVLG